MVKEMFPHMARDLEQTREDFKNGAVLCKEAYEKFKNEKFEEEEYSMSKKLVLGLDYMDSYEYFLFVMRLKKDFSKLSKKYGLLINNSQDYQRFTSDGTRRKWYNDSDCHGKPINHDRFWVITELCVRNIDEANLIAKIEDFGDRANDAINYIGQILEPKSEES